MIEVYIGLGSNLGQPKKQLQEAIVSLNAIPSIQCLRCSSLYQSRPMGPQDQPDYANAVILIATTLSPESLLSHTQLIEKQQGRMRKANRWGPRTLDLDILLYGQQQIESERLTVPHSGMKDREFVLYPLFEIAPELVLPGGEKLVELVQVCSVNGLQKIENMALI